MVDNIRELRRLQRLKRSGKENRVTLKVIKNDNVISEKKEKKWTGAKPSVRKDCEVCETCQEWRDNEISDEELSCGHTPSEALMHSRPCVYISCKHNLYLDVDYLGKINIANKDIEPNEMSESCTLDVANEYKGLSAESVSKIMNIHAVRVQQKEKQALDKIRKSKKEDVKKYLELRSILEEEKEGDNTGIYS